MICKETDNNHGLDSINDIHIWAVFKRTYHE